MKRVWWILPRLMKLLSQSPKWWDYFVVFWMRNAPLQAHVFEHMASEGLEGMTLLEEVVTRTRFWEFIALSHFQFVSPVLFGVEDVIAQLPTPRSPLSCLLHHYRLSLWTVSQNNLIFLCTAFIMVFYHSSRQVTTTIRLYPITSFYLTMKIFIEWTWIKMICHLTLEYNSLMNKYV